MGGVVAKASVVAVARRPAAVGEHRPAPGAVTVSVNVALRSGWSKQAKTFCAMSIPR